MTTPPLPLILASQSPRRKDILTNLGVPFEVIASSFHEESSGKDPVKYSRYNARGKTAALLEQFPELYDRTILGADTCIDLDGKMMGKPKNREEARGMLTAFAGREHRVVTALALYTNKNFYLREAATTVSFASLNCREIEAYLDREEWRDAAGGYRIQGRGGIYIDNLKGCYFNVMGLPIRLFYGMLAERNPTLIEEWGF